MNIGSLLWYLQNEIRDNPPCEANEQRSALGFYSIGIKAVCTHCFYISSHHINSIVILPCCYCDEVCFVFLYFKYANSYNISYTTD